ncbi:MAG: Lrp/AsnC ligand binding domain-containing protein [Gemmatimonadota bacterium]|jgi:DNA-binding Lrp family transcriptional regulator
MFIALVMVRCQPEEVAQAARTIVAVDGVAEVYSVTGEWDLVAMVRVPEWEDINRIVTEHIHQVKGLQRTETHVAFQVLSKKDLAAAYEGFE